MHDNKIRSYVLGLFNHLAPDVAGIDWCPGRAQRSLAPKPPAEARPRDIAGASTTMITKSHPSNPRVTLAIRNHAHTEYKGDQI